MKYLLDTNIIIYFVNGRYPSLIKHFLQVSSASIVIPYIVEAEIEFGCRKSVDYFQNIKKYNSFMNTFEKISFSEKAAIKYGEIRNYLEKSGKTIGPNDLLIASISVSDDYILVTNNEKEFSKVPGIRIENWTKD